MERNTCIVIPADYVSDLEVIPAMHDVANVPSLIQEACDIFRNFVHFSMLFIKTSMSQKNVCNMSWTCGTVYDVIIYFRKDTNLVSLNQFSDACCDTTIVTPSMRNGLFP